MSTQATPRVHRRHHVLTAVMALTVLIAVMDVTILNVALPALQDDLDASNAGLQWSINSYMITYAAFIFTGGVCADRFGRKRTLIAALVIHGAASALAAMSGSVAELIAWRAVMGIGAAAVPTVTLAIIVNDLPPPARPRAIAVWASTGGIALAVGPIVGGLLLRHFWWGSVFLINVPIVAVSLALIMWLVREAAGSRDTRFDPAGTLVAMAAVAALTYGIITGGDRNEWLALDTSGAIVAGLALAVVLVLVERRVSGPALDTRLFQHARFTAGTLVIALSFFAFMGAIYVTTFYFQAVRGYTPFEAGLLMLPLGAGALLSSTSTPALTGRFGHRAVVAAGTFGLVIAFSAYAAVTATVHVALLIAVQVGFGLAWGCIMAPATAALMSVVPPPKAGAGQAVAQTLRQVGSALGIAIIGSIGAVVYRTSFAPTSELFPEELRDEAAGSVGGTLDALRTAAERAQTSTADGRLSALGRQAPQVVAEAVQSYMSAMRLMMIVAAAVSLLATLVAVRWLPTRLGRPHPHGPQAPTAPASGAEPGGRVSETAALHPSPAGDGDVPVSGA